MRHVRRRGEYLRVADPSWRDPLSAEYSRQRGGRWNPPGASGVVHLNASLEVARAQVRHSLEARGIRPEDLEPEQGPVLVHAAVPHDDYVDAVTDSGLAALRLPTTYPRDGRGELIPHSVCQPIGQLAWAAGESGIACRSAARSGPADGEELALFARNGLRPGLTEVFAAWYW